MRLNLPLALPLGLVLTPGEETLLKGEAQEPDPSETLPVLLVSIRGAEALREGSGHNRDELNRKLRAGEPVPPFPLAFKLRISVQVESHPVLARTWRPYCPPPAPPRNLAYHEKGLLGSAYYVDNPVFPLSQARCYVNLDTVGQGSGQQLQAASSNNRLRSLVEEALGQVEAATGRRPPVRVSQESSGASDHISFTRRGLPALDLSWTGILEGGKIHVPRIMLTM